MVDIDVLCHCGHALELHRTGPNEYGRLCEGHCNCKQFSPTSKPPKTGDLLNGSTSRKTVYDGFYVGIICIDNKYHVIDADGGDARIIAGRCDCNENEEQD